MIWAGSVQNDNDKLATDRLGAVDNFSDAGTRGDARELMPMGMVMMNICAWRLGKVRTTLGQFACRTDETWETRLTRMALPGHCSRAVLSAQISSLVPT